MPPPAWCLEYVEFNVKINELENSLQEFINVSFDSITDIEQVCGGGNWLVA